MKNTERKDRALRILGIYIGMSKGEALNKQNAAEKHGVSVKTIQRDIEDLRDYLEEEHEMTIVYDRHTDSYFITEKFAYEETEESSENS